MTEISLSPKAHLFLADVTGYELAHARLHQRDPRAQKDLERTASSAVTTATRLKVEDLAALQAKSVVDRDPILNEFVLNELQRRQSSPESTGTPFG